MKALIFNLNESPALVDVYQQNGGPFGQQPLDNN